MDYCIYLLSFVIKSSSSVPQLCVGSPTRQRRVQGMSFPTPPVPEARSLSRQLCKLLRHVLDWDCAKEGVPSPDSIHPVDSLLFEESQKVCYFFSQYLCVNYLDV